MTTTGLFTQVNNGLFVKSGELADQYYAQWLRLRDAGSDVPETLKKTNAAPGTTVSSPAKITPWFTPTVKNVDLDRIRGYIRDAKEGILFLSFMLGPSGPIFDVLDERAKGMYVRGVVNQFVGGASGRLYGHLIDGGNDDRLHLDAVSPTGIKDAFSYWGKEFMKGGRISVLVRSKVLCIDPFGASPVVITVSHNFSSAASESNDENFLVVEGQSELAQQYAVHIYSVYRHCRWRQYVQSVTAEHKKPWDKLKDSANWQNDYVDSSTQVQEWDFWKV